MGKKKAKSIGKVILVEVPISFVAWNMRKYVVEALCDSFNSVDSDYRIGLTRTRKGSVFYLAKE